MCNSELCKRTRPHSASRLSADLLGAPVFTAASQDLINEYNRVLAGMSDEKKQEISRKSKSST